MGINKEVIKKDIFSKNEKIIIHNSENGTYLSVRNFNPQMKSGQIEIFNLKGKRIIKKYVDFSEDIPLTDYQNGTYIMHLKINKRSIVRKFLFTL